MSPPRQTRLEALAGEGFREDYGTDWDGTVIVELETLNRLLAEGKLIDIRMESHTIERSDSGVRIGLGLSHGSGRVEEVPGDYQDQLLVIPDGEEGYRVVSGPIDGMTVGLQRVYGERLRVYRPGA